MNSSALDERQRYVITTSVEAVIRIGVIVAIGVACARLLSPFLVPVIWGAVLAIAFYPLFRRVRGWLGGRDGLAATLLSLVLIAAVVVPTVLLSESMIGAATGLRDAVESGEMRVPPPAEGVADWPVIGERAYAAWAQASTNLDAFLEAFRPQVRDLGRRLAGIMASGGLALLFTIVALGIAGLFMAKAKTCERGLNALGARLAGENGVEFVRNSALVVKSVAYGVIGIAVAQATLGGGAMALVGVPLWPLWTLILLVLAVAQLPPLVVMAPVIVYVFATASPAVAIPFAIWGAFVSVSDAILKPLFLGRGLEIPALVILLGAIGGMIVNGVIGLFTGAVVLAIGWELLVAWVEGDVRDPVPESAS